MDVCDIAGDPRPGLPQTRNGRDEGRAPGVQNDGVPGGEPSLVAVRMYHDDGSLTVQATPAAHNVDSGAEGPLNL